MADRTLTTHSETPPYEGAFHSSIRVERSAYGQPRLLFIIEDWVAGVCINETCIVVPNGAEFLAPVNEWLGRGDV